MLCKYIKCISVALTIALLISLISACQYAVSQYKPYWRCTFSFEYEDIADDSVVEDRLKVCGYTVVDKKTNDKTVVYTVESDHLNDNLFFELMCAKSENAIIFSENNRASVLKENDVLHIESLGSYGLFLELTVNKDVFDTLVLYFDLVMEIGDERINVEFGKADGDNKVDLCLIPETVEFDRENELLLIGSLCIATEPIKGDITFKLLNKETLRR